VLGSLIAGFVNKVYNAAELQAWAWRLPFLIGGVFGFLAVFLRRLLAETPVFEELRRRQALVAGLPLKVVLAGHRGAVVLTMLLAWALTAGIVVVILMTPTLLTQLYAIPSAQTLAANTPATLMLCLGCVFYGLLADKFRPQRVLASGAAVLLAATYALYAGAGRAPELLVPLYAFAGFAVGVVGVIPTLLVGAFPAAVRFSGISFAYNVAYAVFGGLTPLVVATLIKASPLAPAHYVGIMCVVAAIVALQMQRDHA
jgi:MFS family permease